MVDLETLGVTPQAPVLTIGCVLFDPTTGEISKEHKLHLKISEESAREGRIANDSTEKWWTKQSPEARQAAFSGTMTMHQALQELAFFLPKGCIVWGNGATFDVSILEDLFRQYDMKCPWQFWKVLDVRTVVAMGRAIGIDPKKDFKFEGTEHNALHDAAHQAKYVCEIWRILTAPQIEARKHLALVTKSLSKDSTVYESDDAITVVYEKEKDNS